MVGRVSRRASSRVVSGLLFGLAAALIGGGWQVATRLSTTTTLPPSELVLLRYLVPALLLLPITLRRGLWPPTAPRLMLVAMLVGAGLPFGLVAMMGSAWAPSAHMGVLMAGASPLFAALLAGLLLHERPGRLRAAGLAAMALGIALLSASHWTAGTRLDSGAWRGDLLFLLAALLWAGYTLSFRRSGLTPWHAAALVNSGSALLLLPWLVFLLVRPGPPPLVHAPWADLASAFIWQGFFAGVLGLWTYSAAIARIGAGRAAAFGALVPVFSALGGVWLLGEPLGVWQIAAIAATVAGVLLASGVFEIWMSRPSSKCKAVEQR